MYCKKFDWDIVSDLFYMINEFSSTFFHLFCEPSYVHTNFREKKRFNAVTNSIEI